MRIHYDAGVTGLATVGYTIYNGDGTVYAARTTTGVTEEPAASASYGVTVADSILAGRTVVWDNGVGTVGGSESFPAIDPLTGPMLRNKTVESPDHTMVTLYADDDITPLGSWTWDEATQTRGRLT